MPMALQVVAQISPATHFLVIIRGIYLKGAPVTVYGVRAAALLLLSLALVTLASVKFRKDLE